MATTEEERGAKDSSSFTIKCCDMDIYQFFFKKNNINK